MSAEPSQSKPLPSITTVVLSESTYATPSTIEYMPSVTTSEFTLSSTVSAPLIRPMPAASRRLIATATHTFSAIADERPDHDRRHRHHAADRDVDLARR